MKKCAREISDSDRQRAALAAFEEFLEATDREPFIDPLAPGGYGYNQETLDMFAHYMHDRGSRKKGEEGREKRTPAVVMRARPTGLIFCHLVGRRAAGTRSRRSAWQMTSTPGG